MLTKPTFSVDNVQQLADLTQNQPTLVKQTVDKVGADTKTYLEGLCDEIEDNFTTKEEISSSRKLSAAGDFTGTLNGMPIVQDQTGLSTTVAGHTAQLVGNAERFSDIENNLGTRALQSDLDTTNATVATKALQTDLLLEKSRIDALVATASESYYEETTNGTTGALHVVASGASTGEIDLSAVTPAATGYTPEVGDYVRLVYGVSGGSSELIEARIGANGETYNTVGIAIREQVNMLQGGSLDENAIDLIKLGGVTSYAENIFDHTNSSLITTGGYYDHGVWKASETWKSAKIPIKYKDHIWVPYTQLTVGMWKADNTYIDDFFDAVKKDFIVDDPTCAYITVPVKATDYGIKMVIKGTEYPAAYQDSFVKHVTFGNTKIAEIEAIPDLNLENLSEVTSVIKNLYNKNDPEIQTGGFYTGATNTWTANASWTESGYIPVTPGKYYYLSSTGSLQYSFYNKNKVWLSGGITPSGNPSRVLVPVNVAYLRCPISVASMSTKMIVEGQTAPPYYLPYGKKVITLDDDATIYANIMQNHWNGKKGYLFGTSVTSITQGKYAPYLAALSGMTLVNKGIPGGGITNLGGYSTGQVKTALMNITDGKLEADLITLEVGANEGGDLGTKYDLTDQTFCGCLNQVLRYLQENTSAQIVVIASPPTTTEPSLTQAYYERADKTREVCDINNVYFIGNDSGLGYARIYNNSDYVVDNIHQTDLGGYNFAQFIWNKLKDIPLWYATLPS